MPDTITRNFRLERPVFDQFGELGRELGYPQNALLRSLLIYGTWRLKTQLLYERTLVGQAKLGDLKAVGERVMDGLLQAEAVAKDFLEVASAIDAMPAGSENEEARREQEAGAAAAEFVQRHPEL